MKSHLLDTLGNLGWNEDTDETAKSVEVEHVLFKQNISATLNVHTTQLDFGTLMADVGKAKEPQINAVFIIIFSYGVSNPSVASYIGTHPEIVFVDYSDLPNLGAEMETFDQGVGSRLRAVDLTDHLIRRYEGTDFESPVGEMLRTWGDIVTELPMLASQDSLMTSKYGNASKVGYAFQNKCTAILGSMFRTVKLGGKNQPEGAILIPGRKTEKPGLYIFECKSTVNQPYWFESSDWRQVKSYVDQFDREEAHEVYRLLGAIIISKEFSQEKIKSDKRMLVEQLPLGISLSFLPVISLLTLGEKYTKMLPEIRLRLEYEYPTVQRLFSSEGVVDSKDVNSFLDEIEQRESRIERDLKSLLK